MSPIFTTCVIGLITAVGVFFLRENWRLHDAAEFENRFWTTIAFFFSFLCVFGSDSPFKFSTEHVGIGWAIVAIFTYLAHIYDRILRNRVIETIPNIIGRVNSAEFENETRESVKRKSMKLQSLLSKIDHKFFSSSLMNVFCLPIVLNTEAEIIQIFDNLTTTELNLILPNIPLSRFFYKIKDHSWNRQDNRTALIHMLTTTKIIYLNISSKVMLLDALLKTRLSAMKDGELYACNIIEKTTEDALSELKSAMDNKNDSYSMHRLIYRAIRSDDVRVKILGHIKRQAEVQEAYMKMGGLKRGARRKQFAWRKILSDIDDTLECSGGKYPKGRDRSYPEHAIYPGVLAFYRELDLGSQGSESEEWESGRVGNLVFVSARPHVYEDVLESAVFKKVEKLQKTRGKYGLYTSPSLLAGDLSAGGNFIITDNFEPLAQKKYDTMCEYLKIYPEFKCIFIGDNGQGDVRAAEMVMANENFRDNMKRVYVHKVQAIEDTYVTNDLYKSYGDHSICYFDNYVDAAMDAYHQGLIKILGLRRIIVESLFDFNQIIWKENDKYEKSSSKGTRTAQKRTSITVNQPAIQDSLETKSVSEDDSPQTPSTGNRSRSTSEISDQLDSKTRGRSMSISSQQSDQVLQLIPETQKTYKSSYLKPESKRDSRLRELDNSICKANKILAMKKVSTINFIDENVSYSCEHKPGAYVKCLGLIGIVVKFREYEGIYEVDLLDNAIQGNVTAKAYVLANILDPFTMPKDKTISGKIQPKTPIASSTISVAISEVTVTNTGSVETTEAAATSTTLSNNDSRTDVTLSNDEISLDNVVIALTASDALDTHTPSNE